VSKSNLDLTRELHQALGLPALDAPTLAPAARVWLRRRLLKEEVHEARCALLGPDLAAIARELADVLAVTYGAALEFGIPLDAVYREVHWSNMAKRQPDGSVLLREDGKVLKPPGWQPPDVAAVLRRAATRAP
jgi:predicted HAD superfamily Cof-like phosphohydrolase